MKHPLVSINLLTYKETPEMLAKAVGSVIAQTYRPLELNIFDNNPKVEGRNGIIKNIRELIQKDSSSIGFFYAPSPENVGFAKAHNILIERSKGEFIVLLNSDAWLDRDFIANALNVFNVDKKIAAVQSKMYRYDFEKNDVARKDGKPIIDATGLIILKNRRIIARGQGQADEGQYEREEEIFGADGAAPIYWRKALDDVAIALRGEKHEYFDEAFFAYKEDVDIAWRLRIYGWKTMYSKKVIAYHMRGSGESAERNYIAIIKERKNIASLSKAWSWRNQRLMQVKNELLPLYLLHFPRILAKEIASFIYILLFEPFALHSIKDFFRLLPQAIEKRKVTMSHRKVAVREMIRWFE